MKESTIDLLNALIVEIETSVDYIPGDVCELADKLAIDAGFVFSETLRHLVSIDSEIGKEIMEEKEKQRARQEQLLQEWADHNLKMARKNKQARELNELAKDCGF